MSGDDSARTYPTRPYLAVSAAIFRDDRVLIVRRARPPAHGLYTLPGGGVELGETLEQAVIREVREETALDVEPVELVGLSPGHRRMTATAGSSGISSSCRSRRALSPAKSRSTRNWPKRTGLNPPSFPASKPPTGSVDIVVAAARAPDGATLIAVSTMPHCHACRGFRWTIMVAPHMLRLLTILALACGLAGPRTRSSGGRRLLMRRDRGRRRPWHRRRDRCRCAGLPLRIAASPGAGQARRSRQASRTNAASRPAAATSAAGTAGALRS